MWSSWKEKLYGLNLLVSVCDDKKAVSVQCQEQISRGGEKINSFTTSKLCKHLNVHHPEKFKQLKETEKTLT